MNKDNLLFRRQFVLAPEQVLFFRKWKHEKLSNGYYLSVHPDLTCRYVQSGDNFIICIGYILDPVNTSWSDKEIIEQFFRLYRTKSELTNYLDDKGGRYVIAAYLDKEFIVLNDPAGFRQVFFMQGLSSGIWCTSQPSILVELFHLKSDPKIQNSLLSIPLFSKTTEYWYPGNITAFKEITHLTPNHYLNINTGEQVRYWPKKEFVKRNINEGVEHTSKLLRGIIQSAQNRFKMALAITSGLDSRILLAACKDVADSIQYITHTHPRLNKNSNDIKIPSVMLAKLGLKHEIIEHTGKIDPDFEKYFRRNVAMARINKGLNAYTVYRYLENHDTDFVVINGVCGEIARNFYFLPEPISVNAKSLAALAGMSGNRLAIEQFDKWLQEALAVEKTGISLLDLFYWEQRLGNWAAMSYSEYDIAFDSFSPMNCRKMLQCMLEIDARYRKPPNYLFHKLLIQKMWPQTAKFSINPSDSILSAVKTRIKRTTFHHIYKMIKYIPHSSLFNRKTVVKDN